MTVSLGLAACGGAKPAPAPVPTEPGDTGDTGGDSYGQPAGDPAAAGGCKPTGCSGTVCAEEDSGVMTTCEYREEYACYKTATCARQADGQCGWTITPELRSCLGE